MNSAEDPAWQTPSSGFRRIAASGLPEQARALERAATEFGPGVDEAFLLILGCQGRVIIFGVGESGIVGRKIAATFASAGTHIFFVHLGEAYHGDLGMIAPEDVVVLISFSGETGKVVRLIPSLRYFGNRIICVVGNMSPALMRHADVVLHTTAERQACPNNLAPTTSTTVTITIGDAMVCHDRVKCDASWTPRTPCAGGRSRRRLCSMRPVGSLRVLEIFDGARDVSCVCVW